LADPLLCSIGLYAVPLLKHGCAELASTQHTIRQSKFFILLMVPHSCMGVYPEKSPQANFHPGCWCCEAAWGLS
jgi:hypothetical protein